MKMSRFRTILAVVGLTGVFATPALAAPPAGGETGAVQPSGQEGPVRTKELDFEGEQVEGSFVKPLATLVEGQQQGRERSLVKIRQNFVPEIVRSADDI